MDSSEHGRCELIEYTQLFSDIVCSGCDGIECIALKDDRNFYKLDIFRFLINPALHCAFHAIAVWAHVGEELDNLWLLGAITLRELGDEVFIFFKGR